MDDQLQNYIQIQPVSNPSIEIKPAQIFENLDISDNTRKDYLSYVDKFTKYSRRIGFNNSILLQYKKYLKNNIHISVSTKNKYLTVAKIYLKELHRIGCLATDITVNVKNFKQNKKHKRAGLNEAEINLLAEKIANSNDYRLKAILSLLTLQGLRQIEIVRLNVSDLDLEHNTLLVTGKGHDDTELIDLHPNTCNALKNYLQHSKKKSGALFTSTSNNCFNQRLSTNSIWQMVKKFMIMNNVNKAVHGFRHFFTTKLIEELSDLLVVQEFTRHRSLEMLQIYNDRLRKIEELPKYYSSFQSLNF